MLSHGTLYLLIAVAYAEAAIHYLRHRNYGDAVREIGIACLHAGLAYLALTHLGISILPPMT